MRTALAAVGLLIIALAQKPSHAAGISTNELLDLWLQANGLCRGGAGEETMAWCEVRDGYDEVLDIRGWCYGKQGQAGFEMRWHQCGVGSNRPDPGEDEIE